MKLRSSRHTTDNNEDDYTPLMSVPEEQYENLRHQAATVLNGYRALTEQLIRRKVKPDTATVLLEALVHEADKVVHA